MDILRTCDPLRKVCALYRFMGGCVGGTAIGAQAMTIQLSWVMARSPSMLALPHREATLGLTHNVVVSRSNFLV